MRRFFWLFGLLLLLAASTVSCRQDKFTPNANIELRFETDSVIFDTVFVARGSITKRFKVFNPSDDNILIDEVYLGGRRFTGSSPYRLNINGIPANEISGVELRAKDSIYVFVEVTIDPNSVDLPFLVADSVVFKSGNRTGKVQLVSFGQNAIFLGGEVITCNSIWTSQLPIVIYQSVLVDSLCKLTVQPGTRIYFAKNATLFVLGTLEINGSTVDPVLMQGDRLDPFYRDLAGAWNGIHFLVGSTNNILRNTILRNGNIALRVDSLPVSGTAPNLRLRQVEIDNFAVVGLLGYTARIDAENVLISNCGLYNFLGDFGGDYRFRHATFANFSSGFSRSFPMFALTNRDLGGQTNAVNLELLNSIVWGSRQDEFLLDTSGNGAFQANLSHSILRTSRLQPLGTNLLYVSPRFRSTVDKDFSIDTLSPAYQAGLDLIPQFPSLSTDLLGNPRSILPTLGALERIE